MNIPEDLGIINIAAFKKYTRSGELHEKNVSTPFINILTELDEVLFPAEGQKLRQGWRTNEVHVGWYIPPAPAAVPHLLEIYANEVRSLYTGEKHYVRSEEYLKFTAWATWILMNIHPKQDGNGRLAQAVAEYLMPKRHVLGFYDQMWNNIFIASDLGIIDALAVKQNRKRPDVPNPPESEDRLQDWWQRYGRTLMGFYRYQGRDWSAEFLEEAINKTVVDEQGKFHPAGISPGSLGLMEEFLDRAPWKQATTVKAK